MDSPFVLLPLAFILVWMCIIVLFKCFDTENVAVAAFGILSAIVGMLGAISLTMYAIT